MDSVRDNKPIVAIAGASGFVGTALRKSLQNDYKLIGLTRSSLLANTASPDSSTEWRNCDLFSLPQVEEALKGAEKAIYMVHSMLPSSRLVQAHFRDLDLLLADNFIRAAERAGIKQVIYLSGLIPEKTPEEKISPHLSSRLEVERVLQSRPTKVLVLRAGIIFGPGGSSSRILINLNRRLPVMLLPTWTRNQTQSVDIEDVIRAIRWSLKDNAPGKVYDIASHPPMTYKEMIIQTAKAMDKRKITIPFPLHAISLSRLWVSCISGISRKLVDPLLESLRHNLKARPNPLLDHILKNPVPFEKSVRKALGPEGSPVPNPRQPLIPKDQKQLKYARRVRSVQRMPLPQNWTAENVAKAYAEWLTNSMPVVKVDVGEDGSLTFKFGKKWILLKLSPTPFSRFSKRRKAFYITGGLLSKDVEPPGRFEFRIFPENDCLIAAIHGFAPKLPWPIYLASQALIHLAVMAAFRQKLQKICSADSRHQASELKALGE